MWKYIVTYFVVMEFSLLKFSGDSEPVIAGIKIPKNTRYVEMVFDSVQQRATFDKRYSATEFIRLMDGSSVFKNDSTYAYFTHFKLDSIPIKQYDCTHMETWTTMLLCVPPDPNCNKRTCQSCGKQWQTY